jgi:predicted transcriptional regulator
VLQDVKSARAAAIELALLSGVPPTPEYLQQVAELIDRLDELGLVERVTAPSGITC